MKLQDKVAIITGASSGMGEATARLFAKEGATVIAAARRNEKLETLAQNCKDMDGKIVPYKVDMTVQAEIEEMIENVISQQGRLDVLVNNAGRADDFSFVGEVSDEMWNSVIQLDLNAVFYATRAAVKYMRTHGGGNIINLASVAGIGYARAGIAYTVAKHGVVALTKNTAFGYAKDNIRCNAVCPGTVETPLVAALSDTSKLNKEGFEKCISGSENSPRNGKPFEIANTILFLADDAVSSLINGTLITADAGWTCY